MTLELGKQTPAQLRVGVTSDTGVAGGSQYTARCAAPCQLRPGTQAVTWPFAWRRQARAGPLAGARASLHLVLS